MNQYTSGWSPEDVAELIRLNGEGLNATEIGKAIGRSRRAVNCKRKMLGLRPAPMERVRAVRKPRRTAPAPVAVSPPPAPAPVIDFPIRGLTIAHPDFGGCRWPVGGDGHETRFCCRPIGRGAYCTQHADRAYVGPATPAAELLRSLRRFA